jgi:hypothetical protein
MAAWIPDRPLERWEREIQGILFLLIATVTMFVQWNFHGHDPIEFLRHGNDSLGYYQWLPAAFITGEFDQLPWAAKTPQGTWISLFTLGLAVVWLPFFLLGHLLAGLMGYPQDGYSPPYGVAFMFGASVLAGAAITVAFRLARRFSGTMPAAAAAVTLYAGTNLLHYCVEQSNMSHLPSMFLIGVYALAALRILDGGGRWNVLLLITSGGLLFLIRQTNVFVLLLPFLFAGPRSAAQHLSQALRQRWGELLVGGLFVAVPFVLQMVYWYHITGSAITFTYGAKGEHFEFTRMVPGRVLFDVRNGWLVYTPLFIPVLIVLVRAAWRGQSPARTVLLLVVATLLIYSAWWCWYLGTAYGHRGFIDLYALLAIPLAWLFAAVQRRSLVAQVSAALVLVVLIHVNVGLVERYDWWWSTERWTWQYLFAEVSDLFILENKP